MTGLIIEENRRSKDPQMPHEDIERIGRQAEKLLEKHRDELPGEIVTMLRSPLPLIQKQGLAYAAPWLVERTAKLKEQYCHEHPDYEEVRRLMAQSKRLLTGQFGEIIKIKLSTRNRRLQELDMYQILNNGQVGALKKAVQQAEQIQRAEAKVTPKPKPSKSTKKRPRRAPASPIRHEIIVEGEQPRERRPKKSTPAFTGLPPVRTDNTDTSCVDGKPFVKQGAPNPMGLDAELKRTGEAIANPKNRSKRVKGGGTKTRPGRTNGTGRTKA